MKPHWTSIALVIASGLWAAGPANAAIVLMDFGNNNSYRGVTTPTPDPNGNTWNSVQTGVFYQNLVDTTNTPTTIDFGFSTPVGTDSYNGPAGDTSSGTPASHVPNVDIDAAALGILGVKEAVFDYVANASDTALLRFEIQELDVAQLYRLTFFGSHKYNTENTTRYSIYSDDSYTTLVASVDLLVGVGADHNRDRVAVLDNLAPQLGNIFYVQVDGATMGSGYLNCLAIETVPEPSSAVALAGGGTVLCSLRRRRMAGKRGARA
jgi:hypothetical protein